MADNIRALEVLNYLKLGGYELQDLLEAAKAFGAFADRKPAKDIPLDIRISRILHVLGIPIDRGYQYLKEAITEAYYDLTMIEGITTKLYPKVAENCQTTAIAVERGIRHSIKVGFNQAPPEIIAWYFRNTILGKKGVASNKVFISQIVEALHFEEKY